MFSLILMLFALSEAKLCSYSCSSAYPTLYGSDNLAPGGHGLPPVRATGFSPADETSLCADEQIFDFATMPLPTLPASKLALTSENFLAVCDGSTERALKFFSATPEEKLVQKSITPIDGEDSIVGFTQVHGKIYVLTAENLHHFEVMDSITGEIEAKYTVARSVPSTSAFVPLFTGKYVIDIAGGHLTVYLDGESITEINTGEAPLNGYGIAVSGDIIVYMSGNGLVKVDVAQGTSEMISLEAGRIIAAAATSEESILVAVVHEGSTILSEVSIKEFETFDVFGEYNFEASGMSRAGYRLHGTGNVALISLTTNQGLVMIAEQYGDLFPKGAVYAHYDTAYPLTGKPTVTRLGQPLVFGSDGVVAFTDEFTVTFASTEEDHVYLPSPIMLGQQRVVGVTSEGVAVLFTWCKRYKVGEEVPENACPFADLPDVEEIPTWLTMMAGAAAVLAVPVAGEYACMKMKVCGNTNSSESKPGRRRKKSRQSESTMSIPLTPIRK